MDESRSNDIMRWLATGVSRRTALKGFGGTVTAGLALRGRSLGIADQTGFHLGDIPTHGTTTSPDQLATKQELVNDSRFIDAGQHGAVGDGVTAASASLQAAIDEAGATKRPLWIAPGTYIVDAGLTGVDDLTVFGYGSTLRMMDAGKHTPTLGLTQVKNIRLYGLTIDGNRDAFEVDTEWKHALGLFAATNVTVEDCLLKNAKGDGLYIGPPGSGPSSPSEDVLVRGVRMEGNHRQGCSVTGAQRAQFVGCRFADTSGTPPQAGVDIEPDSDDDVIMDVAFWGCEFSSNASAGIKVSLRKTPVAPQGDIRFVGCNIGNNALVGVELAVATGVSFHTCNIHANGTNGVEFGPDNQDSVAFIGGSISGNAQHGILLSVGSKSLKRFKAMGVTVENNGTSDQESYDGILVSGGEFTDILIDGCTITGHSQRYGIHTVEEDTDTEINHLRIVNNDFTGNGVGGARLVIKTETLHVANNFGDVE